eukprot:Plantae.Rhodophyta-Hildenbrandia_rubra.ctg14368.p1 GENE.Plantae.Rhodophyta-Hildenbrandia_rubra.ctg14368~~Plantae.Rhodophyta-Hildenbrandia_rubra.ctg14368.p1  ORF type:complete len:288 (-),score=78.62 Plantae.Rhodophyta-Hildenbrandia_rubra.ctg14368:896-1759(-)
MAFVPTTSFVPRYKLGSTQKCSHLRSTGSSQTSRLTMMATEEKEKKKSLWVDNAFTGGFPGGEAFFLKWTEGGMKEKVPDLDDKYQPDAKKEIKGFVRDTPLMDKFEYFKEFVGISSGDKEEKGEEEEEEEEEGEDGGEEKVPDESLYERWFPKERRNLAPMIEMVSVGDYRSDRVGMRMGEVEASAVDVWISKERKNMAPFIEIEYGGGGLGVAGVRVSMKEVQGLPTLAPPGKQGDTVTTLTPGSGGGFKLDFSVQGQGPVNVYSDPRCVENFEKMFRKSEKASV